MEETYEAEPAPKRRTKKAPAAAKTVEIVVLPWQPGGLHGAPLALSTEIMNGDTAIMCARLTFAPTGEDVWIINPHRVTQYGMLHDEVTGSKHPWKAVSAWCELGDIIPDEDRMKKMV